MPAVPRIAGMAASKLNLYIEQGATFSQLITWKAGTPSLPVDLTGCTARMQIRAKTTSDTVLLSLTTENSRIALGGAAGTITLTLTDEETAVLAWPKGVYDLEIAFGNGTVRRLLYGSVVVSPEVTRAA